MWTSTFWRSICSILTTHTCWQYLHSLIQKLSKNETFPIFLGSLRKPVEWFFNVKTQDYSAWKSKRMWCLHLLPREHYTLLKIMPKELFCVNVSCKDNVRVLLWQSCLCCLFQVFFVLLFLCLSTWLYLCLGLPCASKSPPPCFQSPCHLIYCSSRLVLVCQVLHS